MVSVKSEELIFKLYTESYFHYLIIIGIFFLIDYFFLGILTYAYVIFLFICIYYMSKLDDKNIKIILNAYLTLQIIPKSNCKPHIQQLF